MFTFMTLYLTFFSLTFVHFVAGHIAFWDDSMFGRCGDNNQCENTEQPILPLQDMTFDQWWWHGYMDFPPVNDSVTALPAGQSVTVQLAGNVAFTKLGQHPDAFWPGGGSNDLDESIVDPHFWNDGTAGNLHTTGKADTNGCVLAIAYTDDPKVVRPEDFVVFSVQQTCVWHRDTVFEVPADMPPCPNGKCMCSWFWIHNSNGGSDQMYQTAFQCNITYAPGQTISTKAVGRPVPPVNCADDASTCIKGPKQPMYWKNTECNNMPEPGHFAPGYLDSYGFAQGAQNDIFETINTSNWTCPQSKASGVFASQGNSGAPVQQPAPGSTQAPASSKSVPASSKPSVPVSVPVTVPSAPVDPITPKPIITGTATLVPTPSVSDVPAPSSGVVSAPSSGIVSTSSDVPAPSSSVVSTSSTSVASTSSRVAPSPIAAPASGSSPAASKSQCSGHSRRKRSSLRLRGQAFHHSH
ncbi:hypothetical protein M422DRAFT_33969 [Sphaerobolus stellatus SS14]|uniref:Lytic polysaccharide monooxygenase n=1 Tax=Sphaerobolus stellatus (strain SS14) TaxID=990650 RepID=A0A0C9VI40_SPHS4|nr:hypothetical protein M422DRAFT_33969 [Sphaerobolus stellatus SS14]